jgi:hypothetical protein
MAEQGETKQTAQSTLSPIDIMGQVPSADLVEGDCIDGNNVLHGTVSAKLHLLIAQRRKSSFSQCFNGKTQLSEVMEQQSFTAVTPSGAELNMFYFKPTAAIRGMVLLLPVSSTLEALLFGSAPRLKLHTNTGLPSPC